MVKYTFSRRDLLLKSTAIATGILSAKDLLCPYAFGQSIYNPNITELTQFTRGDLPILIVSPHGGTELVNGIPSRRNISRPVSNFSYYSAVWTREICSQIERTIKRLSGGKSPYMVLNLAHRRYVDVNREESDAYEAILNAPRIYWEYHDFINEYVNRMHVVYNNPILIEITGQSDQPDFIVRRTLNGKAVERLVKAYGEKEYNQKLEAYEKKLESYEREVKETKETKKLIEITKKTIEKYKEKKETKILEYGRAVYTGDNSLISEINKRGYRVNPDLNTTDSELSLTIAGNYTLERYGTREINNINVIQLVIGSNYRRTSNYLQTGRDIGNAIWAFAEKYIIDDDPR